MRPALLLLFFTTSFFCRAQNAPIDSIRFFLEEKPLEASLSLNFKLLMGDKTTGHDQPAIFTCTFPDSTVVSEPIHITTRGQFRRTTCYLPPIRLNFHNPNSPRLYTLNALKLVNVCKTDPDYEQLLLKEFLIYKMYNQVTDLSHRVRLLKLKYVDEGKKKPFVQYAYLIESLKALEKRNHCKEFKSGRISTESTDRKQMTLVAIFQYMVGNTDWAVTVGHNIKLIYSKKDSTIRPYPIAHDFDFSGLVNAEYAIPDPKLGTESVTERVYRGYPRTMLEIEQALKIFNEKKEAIYALIDNFEPLTKRSKGEMKEYLDQFYRTIGNKNEVKSVFIDNARTQ